MNMDYFSALVTFICSAPVLWFIIWLIMVFCAKLKAKQISKKISQTDKELISILLEDADIIVVFAARKVFRIVLSRHPKCDLFDKNDKEKLFDLINMLAKEELISYTESKDSRIYKITKKGRNILKHIS